MKRCSRCDHWKSLEEFAWRRIQEGQRDTYCRPCRAAYKQEHYAANKERYVAKAMSRKNRAPLAGRVIEAAGAGACRKGLHRIYPRRRLKFKGFITFTLMRLQLN